jgi:putative MATE family efflux protein
MKDRPRPADTSVLRPRHKGSLAWQVLALAGPATIHYLLQTVVFFTDRLMLGWHAPEELAASGVVGPITWSFTSIFAVFTVGTLAVIARDTGAGRPDRVRSHAVTALWMALALGVVVGLGGLLLADPLVRLFRVETAVSEAASSYLLIVMPSLPVMLLGLTLTAIFQAWGDTFTPMIFSVGANALNIAGNYVLIFGRLGFPEMGMQGAAISSVAAIGLLSVLLFMTLLRRKGAGGLRLKDLVAFDRVSLKRQLDVAGPAAFERVVFHAGFFCYVLVVAALGTLSMAAHQALIAIQSIVFLPGEGFAIAAAVLMGQKLGANQPDEAARGTRIALYMAMAVLVSSGLIFFCFPQALISIFTNEPRVTEIGVPALRIGALEGVFLAVVFVLSGGLRGAGDTRTPMIVTIVGTWFVRLPAVILLGLGPEKTMGFGLGLGLTGVWIGSLIDWIVRTIIIVIIFRQGRWRKTSLEPQGSAP